MDQDNNSTKRLLVGLAVGVVFGLGVGLILGLLYAYQIRPVEWVNAGPQDLRVDFASYYLRMVAESYAQTGDLAEAQKRLDEWDTAKLQEALERAYIESSPEAKMHLDTLVARMGEEVAPATTPAAAETPAPEETPAVEPEGGGGISSLLPGFLVLLLFALALGIIAMFIVRMRKRRQAAPQQEETPIEAPAWAATLQTEESDQITPPLTHFVASYALGNNDYEESFSVETTKGDFLGECGVALSETLGEGDPDRITAFEIWAFDKNDIRTLTKVLMSEYAFNDPDIRAKLAQKGEPVLAQINEPMVLETATLRLDAVITEMSYGTSELPPNSFFDRLTIELVARAKEGNIPLETVV